MKKIKFFILIIILLGAFVTRLYRFDGPIADWHSWRQSDTSAVSRNFVKSGFDFFHPRFDDLSNVPSGIDNPDGYRFVEVPIYNFFQAGLFKTFGIFSLVQWGRLVTIFSSLLTIIFIYLIVKKYRGEQAGLLSAFFFAFLPFNIYFGRTILPDSLMVMAILGGIYFFDKWLEEISNLKSQIFFILSVIFTASAFLLKPYALFFTLPMIYLVWKNFGIKTILKWQLWIFLILSIVPLVFWRAWMMQYPQGIPQSTWLFNGGDIRFKGAFFQWIFGDRIGRLILGYWGLPLLILGIIAKAKNKIAKNGLIFFLSFIASSLLYIFVIARGNVQHDYYQILIMPTVAIFLGLGGEFLLTAPREYFHKSICYLLFVICSIFMFSFSWFVVRDYFNINNPSIVIAGKAVDELTEKNAKIIAPYDGDTSFLYQTNRAGWASFEKSLPEMVELGADYLVLVNPAPNDYNIGKTYKIVSAKKEYILFNLHNL
ncbi:MAG: glycosyltransferase family 39 protein [Candidatus Levyibacteriota bacterium]